ncbi:MAG: alpha/beta fold hydrolase [bacterium]
MTFFITLPFICTIYLYHNAFGKRISYDNNYFEHMQKINPNLKRKRVNFPSNKGQLLKGYFYFSSKQAENKPKALVVFAHGMGVNHENYIAELNHLVENNYLVFAYDNTGVNSSEGKKIKGLLQSPIDLKYTLDYISTIEQAKDLPKFLLGHSWGGFAVTAVNNYKLKVKIDGIINLAGFEKNNVILKSRLKRDFNKLTVLLLPYIEVYQTLIFGKNTRITGIRGLKKTDAKVLLIHSTDDNSVGFEDHFLKYHKAFKNDDRFKFITYVNAGHRLTINSKSVEKIKEIIDKQAGLDKTSLAYKKLNEERSELINDFNYNILNDITSFIESVITDKENQDLNK